MHAHKPAHHLHNVVIMTLNVLSLHHNHSMFGNDHHIQFQTLHTHTQICRKNLHSPNMRRNFCPDVGLTALYSMECLYSSCKVKSVWFVGEECYKARYEQTTQHCLKYSTITDQLDSDKQKHWFDTSSNSSSHY